MIKRKSKAFLCAIASIGFINSIENINASAISPQNVGKEKSNTIHQQNQNNTVGTRSGNDNDYFSDTKGHWAKKDIDKFINLGYISGYSDKTFKPNNSITRSEFVKILNNAFGLTNSSGKVFSDTQDHWAKKDIDIAVTNGVCNGKSATEFKPNDPITREEAALMISNYEKISDNNHDKINAFNDTKNVSDWAKDGVEGVIEKGYMNGYNDNTFKPKGKITRAEAVSTLSRVNEAELKLNQEEANKVIAQINDLEVSQTSSYKEEVKKVRKAYNELNEDAKKLVTNLEKLESSERISNVIDLIDNLPIKIQLSDEEQVKEVRAAFDALSAEEQKSIPFTQTGALESAEATISLLKKEIADKEIVADLIKRIEDLKGKTINLKEHEAEIKDIRAKYDALEYVRRAEVTNYETFRLIELDLTHIYESIIYVEGLIMDLPETVDLTHSDKVKEAKEDYDKLHANNQVGVKKALVDKLNKAVDDIKRLEEELKISNQEEANKVIAQINDIELNQTSLYEEEIEKARSAYNNLNEDAKSLVTNLEKLQSSERILSVVRAIYDLPLNITLDHKNQVQEVRNAYDALTDEEKTNITEFDLGVLISAELKISALGQIESDKVTAQELVNRIDALDTIIESNDRDEVLSAADEIKAIRDAYEKLDYYAKKSVTNYDKLFKAECKLAQVL